MTHPQIDLEVEKDIGFQQRAWVAERIGWTLMALLLVAAALGVFGRGPLSSAQVSAPNETLRLDYERCVRLQAPTELRVRWQPTEREVSLSLPRSYWESVSVKEILPPPANAQLQGDEFVYRFLIEPETRQVEIVFRIQPQRMGPQAGSIAADNAAVPFRQFVLP